MITDTMHKRMQWLADRGGSGVIDKYGRVVAEGQNTYSTYNGTWLKLVAFGFLTGGQGRLSLTPAAYMYLEASHACQR